MIYYVTGGTLPPDAPSYVPRQADTDLYEGLSHGEFCYVLHARQMGKSSLMAHTMARLRQQGIAVTNLDLTRIGQNLTVEQWYDGLLAHIGRQLDLEDELEDYWLENERMSPLQRWLGALQAVVLRRCSGPVVIAIDEIDAVRSLPFSTDEFFAAIRDCYNRRSQDPEFARLAFCFLGVATPSDLIQDARTTPFNIGRRIEITDFTASEAAPLAQGLGRSEPTGAALLKRVLYWTRGHPYLTQRLCQAVAADGSVTGSAGVDRVCRALFFSHGAREQDDNLLFVRQGLLNSPADRASLLDLYGQVQRQKRLRDDGTNPAVSALRLSGIVRVTGGGFLRVRNRIYARVFDRSWVSMNMPDAELRRQQAAYRRGLLRATALAAVVVTGMGGSLLVALIQAHRAAAFYQADRRGRYVLDMTLAQTALNTRDFDGLNKLLEAERPKKRGEEDLRGFEWRYLWRLGQRDALFTFAGSGGRVASVAFSPDGKRVAAGDAHGTVKLWDVATKQEVASLRGPWNPAVWSVAFSPDGRTLVTGSDGGTFSQWDLLSQQEVVSQKAFGDTVTSVALSADGRSLAICGRGGGVKLWDLKSRQERAPLKGRRGWAAFAAFSPDGRTLAVGGSGNSVQLWDVVTRRQMATLPLAEQKGQVRSVAFSPSGGMLAAGCTDRTVKLWDLVTQRVAATLNGHTGEVLSLAYSPDGKILATGSQDDTVKLWDMGTKREIATFHGHKEPVLSIAFSPDGKTLASGSEDGSVKLWNAIPKRLEPTLGSPTSEVVSVAFSPDGKTLATGSVDQTIKLWDVASQRGVARLRGHAGAVRAVVFSPDGRTLASGGSDHTVRLWDLASQRDSPLVGHTNEVWTVAYSPDGRTLASGDKYGTVKLWDLATKEVTTLQTQTWGVMSLAFAPDGKTLAVGSNQNSVELWDVPGGRRAGSLQGHGREVASVAYSSKGSALATGSYDHTAILWDTVAKREALPLKGHKDAVLSVAFSPDGRTVATGSADSTVKLWNVAAGREVGTLRGHRGGVNCIAFSPDGETLATAGRDKIVRLWRAASLAEADASASAARLRIPR